MHIHTHTHTHVYIYIYIYQERERERPNLVFINKKKKLTGHLVYFAVTADNWKNIKGNKWWVKYLDLAGEPKKLWNINITAIPIVV